MGTYRFAKFAPIAIRPALALAEWPGPASRSTGNASQTRASSKHMGHSITGRATSIPGGMKPAFSVRVVETVNGACAPQDNRQ